MISRNGILKIYWRKHLTNTRIGADISELNIRPILSLGCAYIQPQPQLDPITPLTISIFYPEPHILHPPRPHLNSGHQSTRQLVYFLFVFVI